MNINFDRIFKPTIEEQIEDLQTLVKSHHDHIGDCTTCKHYTSSLAPGFVTDYGECKMEMEYFTEKVCGLKKTDCKYYTENLDELTSIQAEIEKLEMENRRMYTGKRTCENCSHREVCSLKNSFMEFTQSANQLIDIYKQRFDFVISCKNFREDPAIKAAPFVK